MGGIGKTTIADAIFHQIPYDEYGKCFIQNVRQRLEQCGGLVSVQQEVLSKVLKDQDIKLDSLTLPQHIKERLCWKKVFIVLDDVDNFLKLQKLAGGIDRLGPGSRIIITTRRRDILYNCGVNDDYIYEVKGLSNQEAHQLFCEYAFRQSPLPEDLMALSHEILWAINGNPLGLIVAGSSLLKLNKVEWQSVLNRLKKSSEIFEVLKISYNGLEEEDKHTFLDIACFFVGKHVDYLVKILDNCSHSLRVLFDRSLITISNDKIIQMHDLLQEMGREIVCKEDLNNPGNRSRLWTQEEVLATLKNGDRTNAVRGIFLNMAKMNVEHLSSQAFKKMKNLRFLKFYYPTWYDYFLVNEAEPYSSNMRFPNDISYLSNKLRSLNWFGYPLKALPSNFIPENLVELNLRHSNIEKLWEDNMHTPKLRWIILVACPYLIKVLDLLDAPLLEKIDIQECKSLLDFPSPVHHFNNFCKLKLRKCGFNNLRELNARNCKKLQSFAKNIHFPSLISLDLSGCDSLTELSDLLDAPLLKTINLEDCNSLLYFPVPFQHFNNLCNLNLRNCKNLRRFPSDIHFPSLECLNFHGCIKLTKFPLVSGNIKRFYMRKTAIDKVPSSIENLPELVELDLAECTRLKHISNSIHKLKALRKLNLSNCSALECSPEISDTMGTINGLHHSIENLSGLEDLQMRECKNLEILPINIYNLTSLNILDLSGCSKLKNLFGNSVIDLSNCGESATRKPPICRLSKCELYFTNCLNLNRTALINFMGLQINQHRDMTTKGCGTQAANLKYFYPGSEVPGWFNYQTDGSSIIIQMTGHDHVHGQLIGLAACAVIEFDKCISKRLVVRHCYSWDGEYYAGCLIDPITIANEDETLIDSDHVALWYSDASILELWASECQNYLFEFFLLKVPMCRVKYCGVCPIYEKHNITLPSIANETCGATNQDFGETSLKE